MTDKNKNLESLKIVLLGNKAVGKTCILLRFSEDKFIEGYEMTIGLNYRLKKMTMKDNEVIKVQIWDTSGEEKFQSLSRNYYRTANGILVVYDMTSKQSFEGVKKWMEDIKDNSKSEELIIMLVGNKVDKKEERVVSYEEGEKLAKEYNIPFFETSAKENIGITDVFQKMADEMYNFAKKGGATNQNNGINLDNKNKKGTSCCSVKKKK